MAAKATTAQRMWARWPMDYGFDNLTLDQGQVFELQNTPNDEKLIRLGYCAPLEKSAETYRCAECGGEFTGVTERTQHGRKRHKQRAVVIERPYQPGDEMHAQPVGMGGDVDFEDEERRLIETTPLYLDQSAAARA